MTNQDEKILSIFGIIGPIFMIILTIISIQLAAPWFNWLDSHLSDLGNPVMIYGSAGIPGENPAAAYFNGALAIGAVALAFFSLKLILESRKMPDSVKTRAFIASMLFGIGMIFLMLVGTYNSSYRVSSGSLHVIVSLIFFILLLISTLLFSTIFLKSKKTKPIGILQLITFIVAIGVWIITFSSISPWTANAIPEAVSMILTVLWVIPLSIMLYQEKEIV